MTQYIYIYIYIVNQATIFLIKRVFITINLILYQKKLPLGINLTTFFNLLF